MGGRAEEKEYRVLGYRAELEEIHTLLCAMTTNYARVVWRGKYHFLSSSKMHVCTHVCVCVYIMDV